MCVGSAPYLLRLVSCFKETKAGKNMPTPFCRLYHLKKREGQDVENVTTWGHKGRKVSYTENVRI